MIDLAQFYETPVYEQDDQPTCHYCDRLARYDVWRGPLVCASHLVKMPSEYPGFEELY